MRKKFLPITHKSLDDFGVVSQKGLWDQAKKEGYEGLSIQVKTDFEKGQVQNSFHVIFSTDSEDRHGDIVKQKPDLRAFKKNPVLLDSHNYDSIEHIIGKVPMISADEGAGLTQGDVEFFLDNPKGMLAMKAAEQGFLNATSIGFIPKVFDDKGTILEWELLEISAVSVPAQAEALFERSAEEKEVKVEGDPCEMPDGQPGEMHPNDDGEMVCMPKKKAAAPQIQPQAKRITPAGVIAHMATEHKGQLRILAKALDSITHDDKMRSRRKLLTAIRSAMKNS